MPTTTITTAPPITESDLAAARRRGGLAAKLAARLDALQQQLVAANERIDTLAARGGPEYLAEPDLELASWLAGTAADHPALEEPTAPLSWPAADRARLGDLLSQYHCTDVPSGARSRAEVLRIGAAIAELCDLHGEPEELADALLTDDDRAWRRRYSPDVEVR